MTRTGQIKPSKYAEQAGDGRAASAAPADAGPVRVLRIIDKLGYSDRLHGPGRMWFSTLQAFDARRFQIVPCVLRLNPRLKERFTERGIALRDLNKGRIDLTTIPALCRMVREERIDLIHAQGYGATTLGRIAGVLTGVPTVIHHHDTDERFLMWVRWLDKLLAPSTAKAIAVSQAVADFCVRYRHIPAERVVVVPNVTEVDWASGVKARRLLELRKELRIPGGAAVVGSVTRLVAQKDVATFLHAAGLLRLARRDCYFLIVGDGGGRAGVRREMERLGLSDRMRLVGFQADVRPYLALMDVAAFTSRTEGFGIALLEAMTMGRPVVATAIGGMKELIRDRHNGLQVSAEQPIALARAIDTLLADPVLAARLAEQAQQDATAYQVPNHVARLQALYDEVLAQRARTSPPGPAGRRAAAKLSRASRRQAEAPAAGREPIRVLRLIDKLGYAGRLHGPGRTWLNTLNFIDRGRYRVTACVLRLHPRVRKQFAARGVEVRDLRKGHFDPTTLPGLIRLIRRERIELIHAESEGSSLFGRLAGWLTGVPVIVQYHDLSQRLPWYMRFVDRCLARRTTRAVAVGEAVAGACVERRHLDRARIWIIPNVVDPEWAARPDASAVRRVRGELGLPEGAPVIGSVTRFHAVKDVPTLLEAAARLSERHGDAHLVLVGDGPGRAAIEELIGTLRLGGRVHLAGFQEDPRPYLALMDVAAFSSVSEGFPNAVLEAMTLGLAVVATDVGGTRELIRDRSNGLLVPPANPQAMADAIAQLLEHTALARRLAAQARRDSEPYSSQAHVERLQRLYDEVALLPKTQAAPWGRGCLSPVSGAAS